MRLVFAMEDRHYSAKDINRIAIAVESEVEKKMQAKEMLEQMISRHNNKLEKRGFFLSFLLYPGPIITINV